AFATKGGRGRSGNGKGNAGRDRRPAVTYLFAPYERHRFNAVSIGITNEGGVVPIAVNGPRTRSTIARASRRQRPSLESIDEAAGLRTETDMRTGALWQRSKAGAQIDPEFRITFAESDHCRSHVKLADPDRGKQRLIKAGRRGKIGDRDRDVIYHVGAP